MHPVHVRIGRDDNVVIAEIVEAIFNVERVLKQIELFIFVDDFLG